MRRLLSNTQAGILCKDLPEHQKESRAEKVQLEQAALKDALSVLFIQRQLEIESDLTGKRKEFLPLSVYATRGYDKT